MNKRQENWDNIIQELETFFTLQEVLPEIAFINTAEKITNVPLFIESHLKAVKRNNGTRTFRPYLERLQKLKEILTK